MSPSSLAAADVDFVLSRDEEVGGAWGVASSSSMMPCKQYNNTVIHMRESCIIIKGVDSADCAERSPHRVCMQLNEALTVQAAYVVLDDGCEHLLQVLVAVCEL